MAALSTLRLSPAANERLTRFFALYAAHRPLIQRILNISFVFYALAATFAGLSGKGGSSGRHRSKKGGKKDEGKQERVAVDALFFQRLRTILRLVIPGIRSKEALLLLMHSSLLIFRTAISLYVAALDGKIVASLVRARPLEFFWNIIRWLVIAIPATWTNSWLSYIQNKLAIAYRTRLTQEVMKQYLGEENEGPDGKVYYKLANLDDRIKNPDQMITHDIQRFSTHLAAIYSNLAKPILDVILYNYQLSQNVGAESIIGLTFFVQLSAALLRYMTPPFGMYTALSAQMAGSLRHTHSRLVEFSEEVALMKGENTEKMLIEREYAALIEHENTVLQRRWWFGCVEEGIIKWLWGSFGLVLCAIPAFFKIPGVEALDLGGRTEGFVTNRRLLLSSSDAFGRVMYSYKDLAELAGYTARVSLLLDTMRDVRNGKYDKALINSAAKGDSALILRGRGEVIDSEDIRFENVPIVTPNGDILVKKLSFHIKPGQNLLIVGPNGCGKSSLFRILGGLWPVYGGVVHKPAASHFILIPQRPYLPIGTLRDQVIYPDSVADMQQRQVTDAELLQILEVVQMGHIVEREGGWDISKEWRETLSGGDQQKIAWARLFYHRPRYAVLDEATSLVPTDIEGKMMEYATQLNITLLTVSHRPSLWKYHALILHYDGQGGYVFTKLDAEKRLALQEEKQNLETKLLEIVVYPWAGPVFVFMNYHRLYRACGLLSRPNRIPALKRFLGSDSQGLSSKYSEKLRRKSEETGLSLSELIKQADEEKSAARLAEAEQLRKSNERFKKSSVIGTGTDGSQTETGQAASLKKRQDAAPFKELSSILNMERVFSRPHSQEEISDLWMAYLASRSGGTGRGYVGASIPLEMFERMAKTGRTYPTFVVAVPKEIEGSDASEGEGKTGHELFYLQWDWHPAPSIPREAGVKTGTGSANPATCTILFTPLQEYKLRQSFATPYLVLTMYTDLAATHGVVLMKGEITPGSGGRWMLRQEDAQRLVMGLQKYYLWGEKDRELVKMFHERPEEFVWERLLENI